MSDLKLKLCCLQLSFTIVAVLILPFADSVRGITIGIVNIGIGTISLAKFYRPELKRIKKALFKDDDFTGGNFR